MIRTESVFALVLDGFILPATQLFSVPDLQMSATLEAGTPLRLTVKVDNLPQRDASQAALRFSGELYRRLLLRFGSSIKRSESPRLLSTSVTGSNTISTSVTVKILPPAVSAVGPFPVSQLDLDQLAADLVLRVTTPQVPGSAPLYAAIDMFAAAIEAQNPVVRFVIFYSALTLAALFKVRKGNQQEVDKLLLSKNPVIPTSPSPKNAAIQETLYTKIRNDLIHAEQRGWDPSGAIMEIEKNVSAFQRDAILVFSAL